MFGEARTQNSRGRPQTALTRLGTYLTLGGAATTAATISHYCNPILHSPMHRHASLAVGSGVKTDHFPPADSVVPVPVHRRERQTERVRERLCALSL